LEPLWQGKSGYFFYNFILSLFARFSKLDPANLYDIFISFFNCRFGGITSAHWVKEKKISKISPRNPFEVLKAYASMRRCDPSAKKFRQGYFAKSQLPLQNLGSWDFFGAK
jgi:hypothetical protein